MTSHAAPSASAMYYFGRLQILHGRTAAAAHAVAVLGGYSVLFGWLFAWAPLHGQYLAESDLFEYSLPVFLAPITTWSPYEYSGLPAFADPGDFTIYPPYALTKLAGAWTTLIASAFVLAAAGTYAYVYRLTGSWRAAAFAGLAYSLSEAMMERTPHLGTLHAFVWLPYILLAIEGLDGPNARRWAGVGALAMGFCILAGHPQPAVYTSYAAAAYAIARGWSRRARPGFYLTVGAMFVLSGLVASAKLLPLVEASFVMARQLVSYGQFAAHTNSPAQMLSMLFPTVLHEGREAPTYVGLSTLMLAVLGAACAGHRWHRGFWIAAAVIALLFGMGDATPLASIAYAVVPLYDKFRGAGRHLFLFALGASVLAGLAVAALDRGRTSRRATARAVLAVALTVAAGAALLAVFPSAFTYEVRAELPWALPVWTHGVWVQFGVLALSAAAVCLWTVPRARGIALGATALVLLLDTLYSVPNLVSPQGIVPVAIPHDEVRPNAHALALARDLQPLHQRALATGGTTRDPVIPASFARLWQVPIAGGYGPMLLGRYSQLATMGNNGSINPALLSEADTTLDLLAVRYLILRQDELAAPATFTRGGITWATPSLAIPVGRPDCGHAYPRKVSLQLPAGVAVSEVALVSNLACADHVPQDAEVARVKVHGPSGVLAEMPLRAGIETAERALAREEVRRVARHQAAPVFDDPEQGGAHRYITRFRLPQPAAASRLEIAAAGLGGWLTIERLTVIDAAGNMHPQSVPDLWLAESTRWRRLREIRTSRSTDRLVDEDGPDEEQLTIVENRRALPRAWVVGEVTALAEHDAIETVRRSQHPDGRPFDPRRMAIIDAGERPPAVRLAPGEATATIVAFEEERVIVDVSAAGNAFLVLSDTWYPSWRVRVDETPAQLYRANLALRGVVVPAGRHRVTFELEAWTWRVGLVLSGAATLIALALCAWPARQTAPR